MAPASDQALFSCPVVVKGVVAIGSGVSLGDGPGEETEMSTTRPNTGRRARGARWAIVLHDPEEEWWVTEEGSAASITIAVLPAGIRQRFQAPPSRALHELRDDRHGGLPDHGDGAGIRQRSMTPPAAPAAR